MNLIPLVITLVLVLVVLGCNSRSPAKTPPAGPLNLTEWEQLPGEIKYDPDTFERLKKHDPTLRDPRRWERFFVTVIVPNRKRDIPLIRKSDSSPHKESNR